MLHKAWVCSLCSQDFTRKYSAYRHSRLLHHGQDTIIRMIDYVIGRIAGKYNPTNPLIYRTRYKQQASIPTSDDKVVSSHVNSSSYVAHDSSRPNSSGAPNHQPDVNLLQTSTTFSNGSTANFEVIQQYARTLYGSEEAEDLLKELNIAIIKNGGNQEILNWTLEQLRNKMNMKEAYRRIFSSAPTKEPEKHPPLHGHHVQHLPEFSRTKLEKIENLWTLKLGNQVAVYEKIEELIKVLDYKGYHKILDIELQSLGEGPQM